MVLSSWPIPEEAAAATPGGGHASRRWHTAVNPRTPSLHALFLDLQIYAGLPKELSLTCSPKGMHGTSTQGAPFIVFLRSAPLQSKSVPVAFPFGFAPALSLSPVLLKENFLFLKYGPQLTYQQYRGGKACAHTQLRNRICSTHSREPQWVLWAVCLDREVCFHPKYRKKGGLEKWRGKDTRHKHSICPGHPRPPLPILQQDMATYTPQKNC